MTQEITKAVNILNQGGLVAFPTETVYGLGADAANESALQKIFKAKNRPFTHPLIVHLASISAISNWATDIPESAIKLGEFFWPGPLTLILKKQAHTLNLVTGNQSTIGIRIPNHPIAQALLTAFKGGIAAPSANQFTHISPTTAQDVFDELGNKVDLILDGGACEVGLESTIVDLSGDKPRILRPGMINQRQIEAVLEMKLDTNKNTEIRAPGQHHLHYAPQTKTTMVERDEIIKLINQIPSTQNAFLVFEDLPQTSSQNDHIVKLAKQPKQYAHDLYHHLRLLDAGNFNHIYIEKVPDEIEWIAIIDRLTKATARR